MAIADIIIGTIDWPREGAWFADLEHTTTDGEALPSGSISFVFGGTTWTGRATSSKKHGGRIRTHVQGTAGSTSIILNDKNYTGGTTVAALVADVMRESGNSLSSQSKDLSAPLNVYERFRGSAASALDGILSTIGYIWRTDQSGAIICGPSEFEVGEIEGVLVDTDEHGDLYNVQTCDVAPGRIYDGRNAELVRYHLGSNLTVWVSSISRTERQPWRELVPNPEVTSLAPAKVIKQNSDGTLDVYVSGRYGAKSVPIKAPAKPRVAPGSEVLVGYLAGDKRAPYAVLGPTAKIRLGQLLIVQLPTTPFTVTVTWFPATEVGDAAATIAHAAIPTSQLIPIETTQVDLRG
jgi:hypothetical protein